MMLKYHLFIHSFDLIHAGVLHFEFNIKNIHHSFMIILSISLIH